MTPRPWYREPLVWLVIALPLSAVIATVTLITLASGDAGLLDRAPAAQLSCQPTGNSKLPPDCR